MFGVSVTSAAVMPWTSDRPLSETLTEPFLDALDPGGSAEEQTEQRVEAKFHALASPFAILDRAAPEIVPFVSSLAPLAEGERAVAAVPFALVVK